jgi:AcrR family transcriptional regulator
MLTERQEEIIDVALDLIATRGIQGMTIKNLANKIGITEPAIYRHFKNKIHILITILDLFKKNSEQIFHEEITSENTLINIENMFTKYLLTLSAKPSLVSVLFSDDIFRNEPVLIEKISEIIGQNDKILTQIILDGQKNGELRDDVKPKYLATVVMGSLRLCIKKWQLSGYAYSLTEEGGRLLTSIKLLIAK